jgi:hypothetical protein
VTPRLASAAALVAALAGSSPALALGALVTSPPGASTAVSVREAVAMTPGRTVRWGSVEVRGTASTVAWIIPAGPGASLDLTSDAWFEALEAASAPRVVPPDVTPPCGIPGGVEVEGNFTHAVTTAPGAAAVAANRSSLDAALAAYGLSLTSDLSAPVDAAFGAGDAMVVLVYAGAPADLVTRTVRVVDGASPAFPLALVEAGSAAVPVTAFAFGPSSVEIGDQPPMSLNAADVTWRSDGTSSYPEVRDGLLAANPGAWLFETGGHSLLFTGTAVPGGTAAPALTTSYFFRAASYDDATLSPDDCTSSVGAVAQSSATVAAACPPGALGRIGPAGSDCQELVGAGEIDPGALRCGGIADDLAMALSGLSPAGTWLTRARSAIAPDTTGTPSALGAATAAGPYGPVVTASAYAEPCDSEPGAAGSSSHGDPGGTTGGSGNTSGGSGGGGSGDPGGGGSGVGIGVGAATGVASVANDSGEGCDGDSSDSGDSCSGDSTDSSSSSDSGGCDGSSSGDGSCTVVRTRHGVASRGALFLVGLAALARRRSRPARRRDLPMDQ